MVACLFMHILIYSRFVLYLEYRLVYLVCVLRLRYGMAALLIAIYGAYELRYTWYHILWLL